MTVQILTGDALEVLRGLPGESVQCVCTSPPYYGLRCYDTEGQIGLEATPEAHIARLVEVFAEVRRVLRKDGILWLNYGDAYATTSGGGQQVPQTNTGAGLAPNRLGAGKIPGAKPKDLLMLPARVALALQADGWWLRAMLPWLKRSAMPESASDRPAVAVEYVFLLTKSGDATFWQHRDGGAINRQPEPDYRWLDKRDGGETAEEPPGWRDEKFVKDGEKVKRWQRFNLWRGRDYFYDAEAVRQTQADTVHTRSRYKYQPSEWQKAEGNKDTNWKNADLHQHFGNGSRNFRNSDLFFASLEGPHGLISGPEGEPLALDVNPAGFPDAHFATFPTKLIEPLIKAGTSEKGRCPACAAPWVREVESDKYTPRTVEIGERNVDLSRGDKTRKIDGKSKAWRETAASRQTLGWSPSCGCKEKLDRAAFNGGEPVPCTVLDPFGGAGTTGLVADRLGRDAILIELNQSYAEMARKRIEGDAPLLAQVNA